ncbi:MAG: hypothetical protein AAGN35_17195 [Bacteroidota bacterium]
MKKFALTALLALSVAVPGMATNSNIALEQVIESPEIDPMLVEVILRTAAHESDYSYHQLSVEYQQGILSISRDGKRFRVTTGSGVVISILDESI